MDEYVIKQKIQKACYEPRAPESLIQRVTLRAQAVTMGAQAQNQIKTASADQLGVLVSRVLIGQLAAVSELPKGYQPEQLAQQLAQESAFRAALRGGNVFQRLASGELLRQITDEARQTEQTVAAPERRMGNALNQR